MSKRCILGNGWRESWILTRSVSIFLWTTAAVSFLTLGLALILLSFVMSFRTMQPLPRLFCRFILFAGGQRLMLKTPMPPVQHGPYLYMFNHASMLDTLIMIAIIPEYTMAIGKAEQFDVPIWGTLIKRWGAVPIHRQDLQRAIKQLDTVSNALRQGDSLLISPEGTRSPDGRLLAFKKGPFHVAMNQPTPIVPVAIVGAHLAKRKESWLLLPSTIEIRVGSLITTDSPAYQDRDELRGATRAAIELNLPSDQC